MTDTTSLRADTVEDLLAQLVPDGRATSAAQLWRALPGIYRDREPGDLAGLLETLGATLDEIRATLDWRLRDISPLTCQTWLLPYFADLLDVRLTSPDVYARRQEIANAIRWRQSKGTFATCVEIAETVGQAPVVAREGHETVATTPRANGPLATADRAPAITVDVREVSRPVRVTGPSPTAIVSNFDGEEVWWEPDRSPFGVPPHAEPGYQLVNIHTVDTRTPTWRHGHHHPKRLQLLTPVPAGIVAKEVLPVEAVDLVIDPHQPSFDDPGYREWISPDRQVVRYLERDRTPIEQDGRRYIARSEYVWIDGEGPVWSRSTVIAQPADRPIDEWSWPLPSIDLHPLAGELDDPGDADASTAGPHQPIRPRVWDPNEYLLQVDRSLDPDGRPTITVRGGTWNAAEGRRGTAGVPLERRPRLRGETRWPAVASLQLGSPKGETFATARVEQLTVTDVLTGSFDRLELRDVGALTAKLPPDAELDAVDCLLHTIESDDPPGRITLEYCTIGTDLRCRELRASDSILLGDVNPEHAAEPAAPSAMPVRLRYSCAPALSAHTPPTWRLHAVVRRWPVFFVDDTDSDGQHRLDATRFGEHGFGVLHPATPIPIRHGAEDGGELGAFHGRAYCTRQDAVLDKLADFVPAGTTTVLVLDPNWRAPEPDPTLPPPDPGDDHEG